MGVGGNIFGSNSNIGLLDAIGQFEFNELVNFWVGRTIVPTERGELNGPFYHAVFDGFGHRLTNPTSAGTSAQVGLVSMAVTMAPSSSEKSIRAAHICNMSHRCSRDCSQARRQDQTNGTV